MSIFRVIAGYTYGHADIVRRAMSKKKADVLMSEKTSFINGAYEKGIDSSVAEALFEDMSDFANYAFNKSHAAAYAVISYQTAYLKQHYPCEYMAALMTSVLGNLPKLAEYISECSKYSIKVLPPDINESHTYFHPMNGNIVFGMLALKNVGKQFVDAIIRERSSAPFKDFEDFIRRMSEYDLNKRMVESLIKSGAFDKLGVYRSQLLASYETLIDTVHEKDRNNISGQLDMFSTFVENDVTAPKFDYPDIRDFSLKEKLLLERECSGMYFSGHLIDNYSQNIAYLKASSIAETLGSDNIRDKSNVKIAGIVSSVTPKLTKKNDKMAFLMMEDRYGEIECIAFPSQYERFAHNIYLEAPLCISGTVSVKDDDDIKIIVNEITILTENGRFSPAVEKQSDIAPTSANASQKEVVSSI